MLGLLKRLRGGAGAVAVEPDAPPFVPRIPDGERVYAIGDIHGRNDLFDEIVAMIDADDAARGPARTTLILLGDLIDRGPGSCQVVEKARRLHDAGDNVRSIKGNHEEVLLAAASGETQAMKLFLRIGGLQTLDSYGIGVFDLPEGSELETLIQRVQTMIPREHLDYMAAMADSHTIGDYRFVHAGIRPGVPLDEQDPVEQRWIRDSFLENRALHGAMIVHGHSISPLPEMRPNRIGIDTGAYHTGVLTALGLEGEERWLIQTTPLAGETTGTGQEDRTG